MTDNNEKDILAEVEAELASDEVEWSPEAAGDTVAGRILRFEYKTLNSGRVLPIVFLRARGGAIVKVAAGRAVLVREFAEKRIQPGDVLGILYQGTRQTEGGRDYHAYRVACRHQGPRKPGEVFNPEQGEDLGLVADAGTRAEDSTTPPEMPEW